MNLLKNLAEVSVQEQRKFVNSFEHIFCDMDGVIWLHYKPIPGSKICLEYLTKIGKTVTFVTNNALSTSDTIKMKLKQADFDTTADIVNPILAIIEYLRNINFDKKIFPICSKEFKEALRREGFLLSADPPFPVEELQDIINNSEDDPDVGAVVVDYDPSTTRIQLQKAMTYIKRKDCLFIAGACDISLPIGSNVGPLIGNHHLLQCLVEISGRDYFQISKPSPHFLEIIKKRLGIQSSENILVIGDSIHSDMGLAAAANCKKLLVLTGTTTTKDVLNWTHPEELKPEYYIDSLDALKDVLKKVYNV